MKRQDFRFFHRLRVRWAEVDMQKIVFNAHYLMYFDTAFSDYWRAMALPYEESMHELGGDLYVKKAALEYHGSARFDDQLDVALKCARVGNSSITFAGAIFRGDRLLISCELVYVFADPASQTSRPVPPSLRELLAQFEAGEAMVTVKTGSWDALGASASRIRHAVFVEEQRIPMDMERDDKDDGAVHAVAFNGLGRAVATGRLLGQGTGKGQVGRLAVDRLLRGSNLGRDILHALTHAAQQRGDTEVMLHAQSSAQGFYLRQGYVARGEPFGEAGIPHLEMFRAL